MSYEKRQLQGRAKIADLQAEVERLQDEMAGLLAVTDHHKWEACEAGAMAEEKIAAERFAHLGTVLAAVGLMYTVDVRRERRCVMTGLQTAIAKRERDYVAAIDRLRTIIENDPGAWGATIELREAVELVRCLRRLLEGRTVSEIHRAFGAPGDFGYETPIGAALISREMITKERAERLRNVVMDAAHAGYLALTRYGADAQRDMMTEECGDLITTLAQERRGRIGEGDVRSEVADVLIVALQMAALYGWDESMDAIADKTRRLRERIASTERPSCDVDGCEPLNPRCGRHRDINARGGAR